MNGDDDAQLFRAEVAGTHPVRSSGRVELPRARPRPLPVHSQRDEHDALEETLSAPDGLSDALDIGDAASFQRDGLPAKVLRDLARGRWTAQDRLDLHGLRVDDARAQVVRFLAGARRRGLRCVCVIHGRGLGSPGGEPVLRQRVRAWLVQKDEVLAFCDAPPGLGGAGAALILLKSS